MQSGEYHLPVMAETVVDFLVTGHARILVDATVGDGGHSLALLQAGGAGLELIGIDVDPMSLSVANTRLANFRERCSLINGNFRQLAELLTRLGVTTVDGILADLGVSSRQIDTPERGFSYLDEGPLDLRLTRSLKRSAAELLAALNTDELVRLLRDYGEEKLARPIAKAIILHRRQKAIQSTTDLRLIVEGIVRGPHRVKSLARVFQALRIAVNDELGALQDFLSQAFALLSAGGRLAVISYHSLEDRMVKRYFQQQGRGCTCPPEFPHCICGRQSQAKVLTPKPIRPSAEEIRRNRRARSARLRVLQKR